MNQNKGFTLIELMAVVAIVSILAVIALPAYLDYVVRGKVSEGMVFASEAKTSVSEYYYSTKSIPSDNTAAGLPTTTQYELNSYNFVRYIEITSTPTQKGIIAIKFKLEGSKSDNKFLHLIPSTAGGIMSWTCLPADDDGLEINHAPPSCRG